MVGDGVRRRFAQSKIVSVHKSSEAEAHQAIVDEAMEIESPRRPYEFSLTEHRRLSLHNADDEFRRWDVETAQAYGVAEAVPPM